MPDKERLLKIFKTVLWNFFKCILAYYSGFYMMASIGHGAYRLHSFDGKAPFDFLSWIDLDRCCSFISQSKINLMSLIAAYASLLLVLIFSVRRAHWLFVGLITLIHLLLSCIVMQTFPLSYSYWLCLAVASFVCMAGADVIVFFVDEKTPSSVHPAKEKPEENGVKS